MTAALTFCHDALFVGGSGIAEPPKPTTAAGTWKAGNVTWLGASYTLGSIAATPDGSALIAATGNPAGSIIRSTDGGFNWEERIVPGGYGIDGAAYGAGVFMVLHIGPLSSLSHDGGLTWSAWTGAPPSSNDDSLAWYGDGAWLAMSSGAFGLSSYHYSNDGAASWQAGNVAGPGNNGAPSLQSVVFDGSLFCYSGNGALATTPDGVNWTKYANYHNLGSASVIDYAAGRYVVGGVAGNAILIADSLAGLVTAAATAPSGTSGTHLEVLMVSPSGRVTAIYAQNGTAYTTIDNGASWVSETTPWGAGGTGQASIAKVGDTLFATNVNSKIPLVRVPNCGG